MLNGGTNNDLSSSQVVWTWSFVTSGHTLRLRRNKYICLYFVSEGTLNLNCHIWWQQHCRVSGRWDSVITFLFQTLPLSVSLCRLLVVSNAQCIGFILFFLLPISHLYTWVDRSSFIRLLLQTSSSSSPPTFSRVLRARQLWKQCGICATRRRKNPARCCCIFQF